MAEAHAIDAHELTVTRGGRTALANVSMHARYGEVLAVLGPNGAGKSTLLRALSGLVPHRGQLSLAGKALHTMSPRERASALSFVPQQSQLNAPLRVRDVVEQGRYAQHPGLQSAGVDAARAVEESMRAVDVTHLRERLFTQLSTGEQKRVLLGRALCTGARVLLLDEPTASLDIEHALRLLTLLRALAQSGRCIVLVLHHLEEALRVADRALLLKAGALVACGPVAQVIDAERVRALYNVELVPQGAIGFRLPEEAP